MKNHLTNCQQLYKNIKEISTFDNLSPPGVQITNGTHLANLQHNYIKTLGKFVENYSISTFDNLSSLGVKITDEKHLTNLQQLYKNVMEIRRKLPNIYF